jgi:hypothetical protein
MTPSGSSAVAMAQLGQTETVAAPNNLNFTDMISNRKPQLKHRELTALCLRLRERCFAPVELLRGTPLLGCPSKLAGGRCIRIVLFQRGQERGANQSDQHATECENRDKDGRWHRLLSTLDEKPRQRGRRKVVPRQSGKPGRLDAAMA